MTRSKLTLWAAMERILKGAAQPMSPAEIAVEIRNRTCIGKGIMDSRMLGRSL